MIPIFKNSLARIQIIKVHSVLISASWNNYMYSELREIEFRSLNGDAPHRSTYDKLKSPVHSVQNVTTAYTMTLDYNIKIRVIYAFKTYTYNKFNFM